MSATRRIRRTLASAAMATTLVASFSAVAAQAAASPAVDHGGRLAAAAAWEPPPGYVLEASYLGGNAGCEPVGERGTREGKWEAYVCHEVMRKAADLWLLFGDLYVKP